MPQAVEAQNRSNVERFSYILEKIRLAEFCDEPFQHLEIFDFLSAEDFQAVVSSDQIALEEAGDPAALCELLLRQGYEPISFPGCTKSVKAYLKWLSGKSQHKNHEACEGFGMAFRLKTPRDSILMELNEFFHSPQFKQTLEDKFGISRPTSVDAGLQKYLHGYEISPHPDVRRKALTYMLNVNPGSDSETLDIHTHYGVLKPQKRFVGEFWRYNEEFDRCWVPWDWCETLKRQTQNNSIVIFAPSWDTLHAVKLNYDHLRTQRTQFYGNLWYEDISGIPKPQYDQFVFRAGEEPQSGRSRLRSIFRQLRDRLRR